MMMAIIDNLKYDTDTAELLAQDDNKLGVYRTKNGRFFLAGAHHQLRDYLWACAGRVPNALDSPVYQAKGEIDCPDGCGPGLSPVNEKQASKHLQNFGAYEALEKYFPVEEA